MPIREYECNECGAVFEVLYGTTERQPEEVDCQVCDCEGVATRVISRTSFSLKGSGWFATDYASGGERKDKSDDKGRVREKSD